MIENIFTLIMLVLLQAVLGFDNLLYISLESKRAPIDEQKKVRTIGIGLAIILRIILLFVLINLIKYFQEPIIHLDFEGWIEATINIHSLIVIFGGAFILYTAVKEIWHLAYLEEHDDENHSSVSSTKVIAMIVLMNVIFSFDSILSAMALSDVFWVIFVLFLVGVMLLSEGGHLAHLTLYGSPITPMSKATFYFIIFILVVIDIVQGKYQKKLLSKKKQNN